MVPGEGGDVDVVDGGVVVVVVVIKVVEVDVVVLARTQVTVKLVV